MPNHQEQKKMLQYFGRFADGLTCEEAARKQRIALNSARQRIYGLEKMGLLMKSGETRKSTGGQGAKPSAVYMTIKHYKQKTAAPGRAAELPDSGARDDAARDGSGQKSNDCPGPQEAGGREQLICPQEFRADDHSPNQDRSTCSDGDTHPHACLP